MKSSTARVAWIVAAFAILVFPAVSSARGVSSHGSRGNRVMLLLKHGLTRSEQRRLVGELGFGEVEVLPDFDVAVVAAPEEDFSAHFARAKRHPRVMEVEEDFYANWLEQEAPMNLERAWGVARSEIKKAASGFTTQKPHENVPWGVARVHAPEVWGRGRGRGVRVAVVDSGIDCSHPDLQCDESAGINIVTPSAPPMDDNGHGTHVAGTIGARSEGHGLLGVAPRAILMPIKVMDAKGEGPVSDILRGAAWAAKHGAQVLNMSLGSRQSSAAERRVIEELLRGGVTIVASAGNHGPRADTEDYPGGYPGVIAVAASDVKDHIAAFSSRGPSIAFVAPGVGVISTWLGGHYAKADGTSMSSPHVAGLAALAVEAGARGPEAVHRMLLKAANPLCPAGRCAGAEEAGAGMIDARKF